jgi:hypothetical protein
MTIDPKYVLALIAALVMGWFAIGVIFNIRRGETLLRWLRIGLPKIGERTTFRWLGSSVVEMIIAQANRPFRKLETFIVLCPRDVPWLWLISGMQGRRDTLIFRGQLTTAPQTEFELIDPKSWTGRNALKEASSNGWDIQPYEGLQLLAPKGTVNQATRALEKVYGKVRLLNPKIYRLALRKEKTHLELHLPFPDPRSQAEAYFEVLQDVAQTASERFQI